MKRNMIQKLLVSMLVLTMLTGTLSVFAEAPSSWAQAEFDEARGKGLVLPEADSNYQGNITRELFSKLIVNLVEQVTATPVTITIANPFTDTNNTDIIKAYQLGIVNGTSSTTFSPNNLITREQVAAMMMRAARKLDQLMGHNFTSIQLMGDPTFSDWTDISSWALMDIREANALGIMNGVGGNRIAPLGNTTVEQSVLLILRVYNEYLPLMGNNAPEALPTGVFEYDVPEGTSITVNVADQIYDPDGDTMHVVGAGGNITYGSWNALSFGSFEYEFTAVMVDMDVDSVKTVTVSDGVEQTQFEFVFHVLDEPDEGPIGYQNPPFTVNEGESISISSDQIAYDSEGDLVTIKSFELDASTPNEYGTSILYMSLIGNPNAMGYTADLVTADKTITYNVTVTDGVNDVVLPVVINIVNVNDPPVGNPITTLHQDEGTSKIYWGMNVATDPDGDSLQIIDFEYSDQNMHDVGTGSIRDFDGVYYFYYEADLVTAATWTYFDLTVTDGIHEVVVTIRIQVDNL